MTAIQESYKSLISNDKKYFILSENLWIMIPEPMSDTFFLYKNKIN